MVGPITFLFTLVSVILLVLGIQNRKISLLLVVNLLWWLDSFISLYFTWLVWNDRGYSEHWALYGFVFLALPKILLIGIMAVVQLVLVRPWQTRYIKLIRVSSLLLLLFLVFQLVVGFAFG